MRKPVDKTHAVSSREGIWRAIVEEETFTLRDIHRETNMKRDSVREYLLSLVRAGYVEQVSVGTHGEHVYTQKKKSTDAPRVRKDGTEVVQGRGREQMWRTMKMNKVLTAEQLAVAASTDTVKVALGEAKDYLGHLHRAGYLAVVPDKCGKPYRYRMLASMNTGPRPPMVQRVKRVWDPNLKRVMWPKEGCAS